MAGAKPYMAVIATNSCLPCKSLHYYGIWQEGRERTKANKLQVKYRDIWSLFAIFGEMVSLGHSKGMRSAPVFAW